MVLTPNPLRGVCPPPFLQQELFSLTEGFVPGRFCQTLNETASCCLPCPYTDWIYPDNFNTITTAANWINVAAAACSLFLLLSFVVLPAEKTNRHYLTISLAIATIFMNLGFIIPLGAKPSACANAITPNDMMTSTTCAISGSVLLFGGWAGVFWVFLRALSLHLQICWEIILGKTFMWTALISGWTLPAIALTIALVFSGVSFRFGDTCHINHKNSLSAFWIPLLVLAGLTVVIHFSTLGYCIKVYLASLSSDSATTENSGLPSYANSTRSVSPRQAYRRIKRVLQLQWRGIVVVMIIITDVVFFAIVFVYLDNNEIAVAKDPSIARDWIVCLASNDGNKNNCLHYATFLTVNEATVMSVLILLSCNGFWLVLLMGRASMFKSWYDFIKNKFSRTTEFNSRDARAFTGKSSGAYEVLSKDHPLKSPEILLTPISPAVVNDLGRQSPDYFGRQARHVGPGIAASLPVREISKQ